MENSSTVFHSFPHTEVIRHRGHAINTVSYITCPQNSEIFEGWESVYSSVCFHHVVHSSFITGCQYYNRNIHVLFYLLLTITPLYRNRYPYIINTETWALGSWGTYPDLYHNKVMEPRFLLRNVSL